MHDAVPRPSPIAIVPGHGESLDTVDRGYVLSLLRAHGAVIFRGFAADSQSFEALTKRFCARFLRHVFKDLRPNQSADGTTAQVVVGNGWVSLHGEMNYQRARPDVLWFHCVQPPMHGGQTTLADGRQVLAALSPETRRQFETQKVRYRRVVEADVWQPLMRMTYRPAAIMIINMIPQCAARAVGRDAIEFDFVSEAIRPSGPGKLPTFINSVENALEYGADVTFADGKPIPESTLQDIRRASLACIEDVCWEAQDIAMLDNSRVMHGRRSFEGTGRLINARFGMLARSDKRFMS